MDTDDIIKQIKTQRHFGLHSFSGPRCQLCGAILKSYEVQEESQELKDGDHEVFDFKCGACIKKSIELRPHGTDKNN